jgi:outer membrane lipoprotein-sorting protein
MKGGCKGAILAVLTAVGVTTASSQTQPEKTAMAEDVFKNVQVLKGISVNEFMETMGIFSASTLLNCTDCHTKESAGNWQAYADETPIKRTARRMVQMMQSINQSFFGGRRVITCYACHRGDERPRPTPNLAELYATPPPQEPDQIAAQAPDAPSAESLLDKYIEAIGGAQKVAGVTSLVAKGTYDGSPVSLITGQSPIEIYAKTPGQRATIIHTKAGDATTIFDGQMAWSAAPSLYSPLPVVPLTGTDLDAAKVEAVLTFPAQIRQSLTNWRVGYPFIIDNNDVQVVQGISAGRQPVKLYFDSKSGLLVRLVRYTTLPVGLNPLQTDYSDYRDVSGIKVPYKIKMTWVGGQATVTFSEVQLNVPISATRFAKPIPPGAPNPAAR